MKNIKMPAVFLALIILLSACGVSDNNTNISLISESEIQVEVQRTTAVASPATTPPLVTTTSDIPTAQEIRQREDEFYSKLADDIAQAFVEKDTEFLSNLFGGGENAFNFLYELDFEYFSIINSDFDANERMYIYFLNIVVKNGATDIFTLGGHEWVLYLKNNPRTRLHQLIPLGTELKDYPDRDTWSVYAQMCYHLSNDLSIFESMTDFNLLKYNLTSYYGYTSYVKHLDVALRSIDRLQGDEEFLWRETIEGFMERAEYTLGITNLDYDELQNYFNSDWVHGWFWRYPAFVSEEITNESAVIVLDFYGDYAYFQVARTMKYTLEFGEQGVKLISAELIFSNNDLQVASSSV